MGCLGFGLVQPTHNINPSSIAIGFIFLLEPVHV
jgi:hypothetical protein